ncbi:hypothetical protein RRG08_012276 [Elysia crispata]|uniref:Uncharacterized protein n=1 Tax=Elysia crispata TaxID=231223 RepID=A0AAE1BCE8_9GAST|nr:hypothetical protein RRG08_012276 [Elysia crispata]
MAHPTKIIFFLMKRLVVCLIQAIENTHKPREMDLANGQADSETLYELADSREPRLTSADQMCEGMKA